MLPALAAGIAGVIGGIGSFFGGKSKAAQENEARKSEYELLKYQIDRQQYEADKKRALYAGLMKGLASAYGQYPGVASMVGGMDFDSWQDMSGRPAMPAFRETKGPSFLGSIAGGIGSAFINAAPGMAAGGGSKPNYGPFKSNLPGTGGGGYSTGRGYSFS